MTLSGSHLIATYVRRCGGRRRTLVGRWAGWVDRRACGFEAALSTTELRATTLLVYNNLPLLTILWPGNWQIYVTGNLRRAIIWKNKKSNGLGFEAASSNNRAVNLHLVHNTLVPLLVLWASLSVPKRDNIEELRLWLPCLMLRMLISSSVLRRPELGQTYYITIEPPIQQYIFMSWNYFLTLYPGFLTSIYLYWVVYPPLIHPHPPTQMYRKEKITLKLRLVTIDFF